MCVSDPHCFVWDDECNGDVATAIALAFAEP
jgi:hypothetical protein